MIERQAAAIKAWAGVRGRLYDGALFLRHWHESDANEGAEHRVIRRGDRVFKVYGGLLSTKRGYEEYFDRLLLHNQLFPDVALQLEGFTETAKGDLLPLISQDLVHARRGTLIAEVAAHMGARSFARVGESFGFSDGRVIVDDLHGENVLVREDSSLAVIDPIIRLEPGVTTDDVMGCDGDFEPRPRCAAGARAGGK